MVQAVALAPAVLVEREEGDRRRVGRELQAASGLGQVEWLPEEVLGAVADLLACEPLFGLGVGAC